MSSVCFRPWDMKNVLPVWAYLRRVELFLLLSEEMKTFDQEELTEGYCKNTQGILEMDIQVLCLISWSGRIKQMKTIVMLDSHFKSPIDERFTKIPNVRQNEKIITDAKLIIKMLNPSSVVIQMKLAYIWPRLEPKYLQNGHIFTIIFSIGAKFHWQQQLKFIKLFDFVWIRTWCCYLIQRSRSRPIRRIKFVALRTLVGIWCQLKYYLISAEK